MSYERRYAACTLSIAVTVYSEINHSKNKNRKYTGSFLKVIDLAELTIGGCVGGTRLVISPVMFFLSVIIWQGDQCLSSQK